MLCFVIQIVAPRRHARVRKRTRKRDAGNVLDHKCSHTQSNCGLKRNTSHSPLIQLLSTDVPRGRSTLQTANVIHHINTTVRQYDETLLLFRIPTAVQQVDVCCELHTRWGNCTSKSRLVYFLRLNAACLKMFLILSIPQWKLLSGRIRVTLQLTPTDVISPWTHSCENAHYLGLNSKHYSYCYFSIYETVIILLRPVVPDSSHCELWIPWLKIQDGKVLGSKSKFSLKKPHSKAASYRYNIWREHAA